MQDSQILELLRKKSPQTTLEIARAAGMSWHVVQEQLLEMQIDGRLDRITVGRQNLWFVKGQKLVKGSLSMTNTIIIGIAAVLVIAILLQSAGVVPIASMLNGSIISSNTAVEPQPNDTDAQGPILLTGSAENASIQQYNWLAYDNKTNTIKISSDGSACARNNPCMLKDVYNSGLGKIENIDNYYVVNSTIEIESGYFVSEFEHIYTLKPWIVQKNGHLRFGLLDKYNRTSGSIFFETNVTDEINNAALVNEGTLEIYDSNYKVYSDKQNNLYQTDDAIFRSRRLGVQRISDGTTTLYVPFNAVVDDYLAGERVSTICTGNCTIERVVV